ncbi:class I SAM-dependent methyltransferase [Campylobacter ureolyticus]|uniref:Class I SAM-dependent methyltransferase n=1 Tax=Campylobacter ureolyticus TaxID=827 RepID=A0A9Q4KR45_9BACT|nr:class I SAM-dependent methyltransferase [Campylobacter ureolyticus]MCZ6134163.1 class I SAM-dependent methyltransferase [Campylobacter ureolyticus]MCZ6161209.1 class I SAM-dependent methyltransferase [Campylobacter ureolyticus]
MQNLNDEISKNRSQVEFPEADVGIQTLKRMNVAHNDGSLWAISKLNLDENKQLNILDIGCGGGQNLLNLSTKFKNSTLFGIDHSPTSINLSSQTCKDIKKRVFLEVSDVHKMSFSDNKFDLITAFETLYFWENLDIAFNEIKRVLKKDGKFMIFLEGTTKQTLEKWENLGEGIKLKNKLNPTEIKEILNENGFLNVEIYNKDKSEKTCIIAKM